MDDDKLLYSVPEAQAKLGDLGRTTLYQLMASGELRSVAVGRRRMITRSALEEFAARLDAQASTPQPAA